MNVIILFIFCQALQFYWLVSNLISLVQVLILKIPAVRQIANIPPTIKHDPEKLPMNQKNKKGALADFKECKTLIRIN